MRPRKKDENNPDGDFPGEHWFGEEDSYFYPKIPALYTFLLRPDGQMFKLLKAKKVQNVKHPVQYGCFLCKRWLQPDQVENHVGGKTHDRCITQIQHTYELIAPGHEWYGSIYTHMVKRPPPPLTFMSVRTVPFGRSTPKPVLLPLFPSKCAEALTGVPTPVPPPRQGPKLPLSLPTPVPSMRSTTFPSPVPSPVPAPIPVPPPSGIVQQICKPPSNATTKKNNGIAIQSKVKTDVPHETLPTTTNLTGSKIEAKEPVLLDTQANIQGFFDKSRDDAYIGLEYVVEIQHSEKNQADWYACRLCDILYNPKSENSPCIDNMRQHLTMNGHKIKYLSRHFPTIYEYKLKTPNYNIVKDISRIVEKCFGRLKVKVVSGKKVYKERLDAINQAILDGPHFTETQNIVDIVIKRKPEPKQHALESPMEDDTRSSESAGNGIDIPLRQNGDDIESKKEEDKSRPNVEKKKEKEISKIEDINSDKQKIKSDNSVKNKNENNEKNNIKENEPQSIPSQSKLSELRERSLSPISDSEENIMSLEEKRKSFREERQKRVLAFYDEEKKMNEVLDKLRDTCMEDPAQHPEYSTQWSLFWRKKSAELRKKGLTERDYDMKPEWIVTWTSYFETDIATRRRKERESLMRKHRLLPRDLEEFKPEGSNDDDEVSLSSISDLAESDVNVDQEKSKSKSQKRSASPWEDEQENATPVKRRTSEDKTDRSVKNESSPCKFVRKSLADTCSTVVSDRFRNGRYADQNYSQRSKQSPKHNGFRDDLGNSPVGFQDKLSRSPDRHDDYWKRSRTPEYEKTREIRNSSNSFRDAYDNAKVRNRHSRSRSPYSQRFSIERSPNTSRDIDLRHSRGRLTSPFSDLSRSRDPWQSPPRNSFPERKRSASPFSDRSRQRFVNKNYGSNSPYIEAGTSSDQRLNNERNEVSVIATLRLVSALDQAGYINGFTRKVDELLAKAIALENRRPGSSSEMMNEKECYKFFRDIKDIVNRLINGSRVSESENRVCRIIMDNIIILMQRSSLTLEDLKEAAEVPSDQRLIKMAIAQSIDRQLTSEGRILPQEEFNALVEAEYIRVKHQLPSHMTSRAVPEHRRVPSSNLSPGNKVTISPQAQQSFPQGSNPQNSTWQKETIPTQSPASVSSMKFSPASASQAVRANINPNMNPDWKTISTQSPASVSSMKFSPPVSTSQTGVADINPDLKIDWNSLSSIIKTVKRGDLSEAGESSQNISKSVDVNPPHSKQVDSNEALQDTADGPAIDFTDDELISLLKNFKALEPLEQKDLIAHMKKLEKDDPVRVTKLKEAMHKS